MKKPKYTETEKWCNKCSSWKPNEEFNHNKSDVSGFSTYCRKCIADYNTEYNPVYREKNKDLVAFWKKNSRRFCEYGLTFDQYEKMLKDQNGICAMLGCHRPAACVDHDHMTGVVRKLLCKSCNAALGIFGDDPEKLRKAAEYIENFRRG